jgi:hypothetical protein
MMTLEKNGNSIRDVSESGNWFLKDWRLITNESFENGFRVVSEVDLQIEIEGNIFVFSVVDLLVDGLSFTTSENLKNYLLNG